MKRRFVCALQVAALAFAFAISSAGQSIPAPKDVIGFTPGEDRKLASWSQIVSYFKQLDAATDRMRFEEIGKSTMGAPFVYATISSPENLRNLQKYRAINEKLADPRLIRSNQRIANQLIRQGKTIVLITCGIHSTEVGSTLSSMLIAERLVRATDAETRRILDNTIILLVPSLNPDGVDIVKNWYDKTLGTPYEGTDPPELYHKYVGHDNNRDWYAFTQVETQLTVDKIHNVWHPQIVHDIHQQGPRGARMFLPPYMPPVEPNVPKEIIEGFTELGSFIAEDLRKQGFAGITTNSTYDAWTPARAYSHYHGGVRILSETASARIATPIELKFEDLRGDDGYDAKTESPNYRPLWNGGKWGLPDITKYMTTGAHSLLRHASDNRVRWLSRFYQIGKEAVRPRRSGELQGFLLEDGMLGIIEIEEIFKRAGVEFRMVDSGEKWGRRKSFVPIAQPYGAFAKALLEKQEYPNLKDANGEPIAPYDVTAHSISLLMGVNAVPLTKKQNFKFLDESEGLYGAPVVSCSETIRYRIYRSSIPVMDEGWTRWVLMKNENMIFTSRNCRDTTHIFDPVRDNEIRNGKDLGSHVVIFPDQNPNQMLNGYPNGTMPDELTGGIGKDGVASLLKFVRDDGGTLVFLNRASNFAIREFGLPVRDVTAGLPRKEFYVPGSILRTEVDTKHEIARFLPADSIAWFENSPAFEITNSDDTNVEIIARYPENKADILLSGWALGAEKIAGKAALVSINIGKGRIVLFGFRPQYRGQSLATFRLLFNAIRK